MTDISRFFGFIALFFGFIAKKSLFSLTKVLSEAYGGRKALFWAKMCPLWP
tara:strand:- start:894 stop:1046 length:153 start_codon:yes stop_codon:yes gene_type:complete